MLNILDRTDKLLLEN